MINFFLRSLAFRLLIIGCFFQLAFHELTIARDTQSLVRNINHTMKNSLITVHYDLSGSVSVNYHVTLVMLSKTDKAFYYVPKTVNGDIGEDIQMGKNKSITWNTQSEFPEGVSSESYYFSLQANEDTSSSISPWVWIGGAVLVGGAAALLLSKKTQDEAPNVFPTPPGRP